MTGGGWLETWFLNSWIIKISEPSLITAHNLNFRVSHSEHAHMEAGSVAATLQKTSRGYMPLSLQWRKQNLLSETYDFVW